MVMSGEPQRWHGQKSSFSWEQDALDFIKHRMPPAAEPYRAWQTFTFTAPSGHVREVDLLLAAPGGLFLVEIKSHPGVATNHGSTWLFRDGNITRTIENPLHFTDQKAKELRTQLQRAADDIASGLKVPRIEAAVFLSAENLRCCFDEFQEQRVYGRDDRTDQTELDGIWNGFLNQPPRSEKNRVTPTVSRQLPKLLSAIGVARLHRRGKVGVYELRAKSFDAGPTWEDYLADNPSLGNDDPRRVRVYLAGQTATDDDRTSTERAARREYLALQGISHDGIVRAEQYSDELLAGPAVVFRHGEDWQRLDHFIAARPEELPVETKLEMIRQLAEALDHAHRRHLYHRALAPRSVYIEMDGRYPRLRIADWQVAARPHSTSTPGTRTSTQLSGPAALLKHVERSAGSYLAPEFTTPDAPPALLDVFGLGALSYLILTGSAPAEDREQLAQRLNGTAEHALTPSAITDSISPQLDALVQKATARHQAERTGTVREFLRELDRIEEALTAPEVQPVKDPLAATRGDVIEGWTVERVLGKGSTSRALLVTNDDGPPRVFKVALNDAAARRLKREAEQLGQLNDSHVVRLLNPPFQAGPPEHRRTVIGVEYVGDHTLAEELRQGGPRAMTINELERLGEDLFQAVTFLDKRGIWHRDIKPDNLALRKLPKKGRELVLFDFSLAGVPDTELAAGTRDYLDPFLGPPSRNRYDQAAELYGIAITLHEMVSGELPSWGDGITPAGFLDMNEEVQLAEDVFDPVIRDGLVGFFRKALHRDAAQRFTSLRTMTRAWTEIFRDVETVPPVTTPATQEDGEDETDERTREAAEAKREAAARSAAPETPLVAAGLSPYALSTALQHLGLSTAGELARTPANRITALKGIGRVPKFELVRRSMEWRQRFNLSEADLSHRGGQERHHLERTEPALPRHLTPEPGDGADADAPPADLAQLSVDEVARHLVPDSPELRQVTGLARGKRGWTSPWASRHEVARDLDMSVAEVAMNLDRLRARWAKSVPGLLAVRDHVAEILLEHGRILGADQVAAALLILRGSERDDPAERMRTAALCVRAAVETEERLDKPRLLSRRVGSGVVVALTEAGEEETAPRAEDLFAYA
jgi:serine/threonine protein kinase